MGTRRCLVTPSNGSAPYNVALYEGETPLSHRVFDKHDEAIAFAVEALRVATQSNR